MCMTHNNTIYCGARKRTGRVTGFIKGLSQQQEQTTSAPLPGESFYICSKKQFFPKNKKAVSLPSFYRAAGGVKAVCGVGREEGEETGVLLKVIVSMDRAGQLKVTIAKILDTSPDVELSVGVLRDAFDLCRELERTGLVTVYDRNESGTEVFDQENFKSAHELVKGVRREAARLVKAGAGADALQLYKETLLFDAPHELDAYCRYIEFNRPPAKKFYEPRRSVLKPVVDDLQDLFDGNLDFLGVSLPPRVGKSTLCIFFMTWLIGNRPDVANVMSGHSDKLTHGFFSEVLNILTDSETYLWHDVFPTVKVVEVSAKNESIDLNKRKRFPTFTARSVGGTLTGAVEIGTGGCLYVDDLVEDLEESLNPERLQHKYDAYLNQLKDRKKDGAFELMVGTRWNVLDPLGRIEEQYRDNPRYRFRVIPAVNEFGESNFDYPYNLGFSTEYYKDMKESIDDGTWCAKYLGDPYVREGLLFPRDKLRRFYELPIDEPDAIWAVCDPAQGGGDDTFLPVFYQYGNDHYLADCVCIDALTKATDELCANILIRHKVRQCQFENNAAGGRMADKVQARLKERGGVTRITKKHTQANKEVKILSNSPFILDNVLFKDDRVIDPKSDYSRMMRLLCSYVVKGRNKHDDVPDGLAQYADFVIGLVGNRITLRERREF